MLKLEKDISKEGDIWISSNASQSSGACKFDYGNDSGLSFSYRANIGAVIVSPSVVIDNATSITVRKITSTTRVVNVDLMGIYVFYTPIGEAFSPMSGIYRE